MNGSTPASFAHLGGMSPFLMPPTLGPADAKLFEQLTNAQLNNNNFPSLNCTFAPLVPPTPTSTSQAGQLSASTTNSLSPNGNSSNGGGPSVDSPERNTPEYLQQLLKDKRQVQELGPTIFQHVDRILDDEIFRVRLQLFHISLTNLVEPIDVPEANNGPMVTLTEKVYIPTKEHPDFNFVGRLLGPRGTTAKFLEHVLEAKIMVRGKGSMREKRLEDQYRGKPHWEHLKDDLHVLLTVETTKNRAEQVIKRAGQAIKKFLEVIPDGDDPWKKLQLMELATYNGPQRYGLPPNGVKFPLTAMPGLGLPGLTPGATPNSAATLATGLPLQAPRLFPTQLTVQQLRSPTPGGGPFFISGPPPRLHASTPTSTHGGLLSAAPPMMNSPTDTPPMLYPYDYSAAYAALSPTFFEYPGLSADQSVAGRAFFHPCVSPPLSISSGAMRSHAHSPE